MYIGIKRKLEQIIAENEISLMKVKCGCKDCSENKLYVTVDENILYLKINYDKNNQFVRSLKRFSHSKQIEFEFDDDNGGSGDPQGATYPPQNDNPSGNTVTIDIPVGHVGELEYRKRNVVRKITK